MLPRRKAEHYRFVPNWRKFSELNEKSQGHHCCCTAARTGLAQDQPVPAHRNLATKARVAAMHVPISER
jgi:hypothetical protein